jgi:hypothetical protein
MPGVSEERLSFVKRLEYLAATAFYFTIGGGGLIGFWRLGLGETWKTVAITVAGVFFCGVFLIAGWFTLRKVITGEPDRPHF